MVRREKYVAKEKRTNIVPIISGEVGVKNEA